MKRIIQFYFVTILFLVTKSVYPQLINLNPDPNGDPWISGGCLENDNNYIDEAIPLVLSSQSISIPLPDEVLNNEYDWFPPIFLQ